MRFLLLLIELWLVIDISVAFQRSRRALCVSRDENEVSRLMMVPSAMLPIAGSATVVAGVIAFHEAGHFLAAKWHGMKISSFNIGYGPKILSFNDSDEVSYNLRLVPLGGYVAFPSTTLESDGEEDADMTSPCANLDPDLLQNRPPLQRAAVISAGVLANLFLTFGLNTLVASTSGVAHPVFAPGVLVTGVLDADAPAGQAGLRENDVIMRINKIPVTNGGENDAGDDTIERFVTLVKCSEGIPLDLDLMRDGKELTQPVTVVPRKTNGRTSIGIGVAKRVKEVKMEVASSPLQAVRIGAEQTGYLVYSTWGAFTRSLSHGFSGNDVGGPLSVVKVGASVAEYNPAALTGFAATLSANLAVLNALPIPALDGGQLAFVLFELITGRTFDRKIRETVTALALVVLLGLGATTLVGDIERFSEPVVLSPEARQKSAPMRALSSQQ